MGERSSSYRVKEEFSWVLCMGSFSCRPRIQEISVLEKFGQAALFSDV